MNVIYGVFNTIESLLPFVVLLGILVFIHEMGHFAAARYFKVRVEVFSLGFGKKLLKRKIGDTLYCISLIPLGGYVKMFGHHFNENKIAQKDKPFAFFHKPLYARTVIVLAGPLMNFFLSVIVLAGLFMLGPKKMHPVVGEVKPQSLAARAGFKAGDRVLSAGLSSAAQNLDHSKLKTINNWTDLSKIISAHAGQTLKFRVQTKSGGLKKILAAPVQKQVLSEFGLKKQAGVIDGLSPFSDPAVIGIADLNTPAGRAGLQTFDKVLGVEGLKVQSLSDLAMLLCFDSEHKPRSKMLQIKRSSVVQTIVIKLPPGLCQKPLSSLKLLKQMGIRPVDLFIADLKKGGAAWSAGLKKGDFILSVNKTPIHQWGDLVALVQGFEPKKGPLRLEVKRQGERKVFFISPKAQRVMRGMKEETRYMLGVVSSAGLFPKRPAGGVYRDQVLNPFKALWMGVKKSGYWCMATGAYLKHLITGEISKKTLGGVIAIGQAAYRSYSLGLEYFFEMMALLSIQLFLLNIIPLPVLDGGHLLFYAIEFIKGRPLSLKKMMIAHYVGFILLLSLLVFVTFNDLDRWINIW